MPDGDSKGNPGDFFRDSVLRACPEKTRPLLSRIRPHRPCFRGRSGPRASRPHRRRQGHPRASSRRVRHAASKARPEPHRAPFGCRHLRSPRAPTRSTWSTGRVAQRFERTRPPTSRFPAMATGVRLAAATSGTRRSTPTSHGMEVCPRDGMERQGLRIVEKCRQPESPIREPALAGIPAIGPLLPESLRPLGSLECRQR